MTLVKQSYFAEDPIPVQRVIQATAKLRFASAEKNAVIFVRVLIPRGSSEPRTDTASLHFPFLMNWIFSVVGVADHARCCK